MKCGAFGDIHIGQGASIGTSPGERVTEQGEAVRAFLRRTRDLGYSFVFFAGDAWEKRSPTPDEILVLERALLEHRAEGGAPVIAIPGNHDVANIDAGTALDVLAEAGLLSLHRTPEVIELGEGVALCVLPWVPVHRLALEGGDRDEINARAARHLEDVAYSLRGRALENGATRTILMTHFSAIGARTDTGADVGVFREPVLNIDDIVGAGYDLVVLGHIHKPQTIGAAKSARYVGSLIPLNFGETGGHGYLEIDASRDGVASMHLTDAVDYREFITIDADLIEGDVTGEMIADHAWVGYSDIVDDGPMPYVKLRYRCSEDQAVELDAVRLKHMLEERFAHRAWVVPVVERTVRAAQEIGEDTSDADALEAYLRAGASESGADVDRLVTLGVEYLEKARA